MKLNNNGFTLLEILLVIAIIGLISFGSYAGFQKFGERQNLNQTRDTLLNSLNEVKSRSASQVISTSTCKRAGRTLVGHQIRFYTDHYDIQEVCSVGLSEFVGEVKTVKLPTKITIISPPINPVRFLILTGKTNSASTINITISGGSQTKSLSVDSTGVIR